MENTDIYRVTGGRVMDLIRMHIGATRSAEKAIRAIIKKLGASKVTLTYEGKIDYFEFESQPSRTVWKGSKYCARPKASTTAGRQLQQQLDEVARKPTWGDFTKALTGKPDLFLHIDDDIRAGAYWGTVRFGTPDEKTDIWFLFVDREPGKVATFVPPSDGCTLLKLSEYYAALEAAQAKRTDAATDHEVTTGPDAALGRLVGA
jgi:hypothetical protein